MNVCNVLAFTVIEISDMQGYFILRVQIQSTTNLITTGDIISLVVTPEIAEMNTVGNALVL